MSEVGVTFDPDRLADAAIACVLNEDTEGIELLLHGLDPSQTRRLAGRLAAGAADTLIQWAADSGVGPRQAADIWRRGILLRARYGDDDGDDGEAADDEEAG
ncbi:hypothetical protein POF50_026125 [Streptomyces sp. SL13]|uniref:Uncharacterized protein n=1 Tax=Streptantibioticus silvisoli TaxID=2705255 RepID=A0AA90KAS9_9ACTN|nr:hypothetical protein [Streptantibioticus silvisoli]MDI5972778.1 hypothetical protein [Streptantibioticus silvisoli]